MRKDEREYRILERKRMYSIFSPLDETEPPAQGQDEPRVIISGRGAWMMAPEPRKRRQ